MGVAANASPNSGRKMAKRERVDGDGGASNGSHLATIPPKRTAKAKRLRKPRSRKIKQYFASLYPGFDRPEKAIPSEFAQQIRKIESILQMPVWFIIQNEGPECYTEISGSLFKAFQGARKEMGTDKPVALLLESPGGEPDYAYRISKMFQRCSGNKLTVIVPQYAKSAATLIALGAKSLILARDAELGPLDVQLFDLDREESGSALNTVQSLERLNAFALNAVDQVMFLLHRRTGKRIDVLLPHVLNYVATFLRPLLENIDTADYTKKSRDLKLTEEYALRLMKPNYPFETARRIARQLVEKYPTHGFVIDRSEASFFSPVTPQGETFGIGLAISKPIDALETVMQDMIPYLDKLTVVGRLREN